MFQFNSILQDTKVGKTEPWNLSIISGQKLQKDIYKNWNTNELSAGTF